MAPDRRSSNTFSSYHYGTTQCLGCSYMPSPLLVWILIEFIVISLGRDRFHGPFRHHRRLVIVLKILISHLADCHIPNRRGSTTYAVLTNTTMSNHRSPRPRVSHLGLTLAESSLASGIRDNEFTLLVCRISMKF
jgi:hypothetical protein